MRYLTWLRSEDRSDPAERRREHGSSRGRTTTRPRLEVLEDRRVLSTLTVTNNLDSLAPGGGTLRGEIAVAQPGDTIVFDPGLDGQTITLGAGELELNKNLTIQGPGAGLLAINGGGNGNGTDTLSRVFQVDAGATVAISGLTIGGGNGAKALPMGNTFNWTPDTYDGLGGGILNLGSLTLSDSTVTGNTISGYLHDSWGLNLKGGGIYNSGTMTVRGCTVTGNSAGLYGTTSSKGGGIFNDTQGNLTITSSTVTNNTASDGPDICSLGSLTISKDSTIGSKVSRK
jgi:hypothetical protein